MIMKKNVLNYSICWLAFVVLFNIICFATPDKLFGYDKFDGSFWSGYVFAMLTLLIHYAYIRYLLSRKNNRTINNTMMVTSYIGVATMVIASAVCMLIPDLSTWITVVLCSAVLVISLIFTTITFGVSKRTTTSYEASTEKANEVRRLIKKAELLMEKTRGTDKEMIAKKIYDAIRFDVSANKGIGPLETEINKMLDTLLDMENGVLENEDYDSIGKKILLALERRNVEGEQSNGDI